MGRRIHKRPLSITQILAWATSYREANQRWPTKGSGSIVGTIGETWLGVDRALRTGHRGLAGGSSLAGLLAEQRGKRNIQRLPRLTEEQILAWADRHREQTGTWQIPKGGVIPDSGREKWVNIDQALRIGLRGLPGGSSLARLLAERRGRRNRKRLPCLTEQQVLAWADAHHGRTGRWPTCQSGPVVDEPGETWMAAEMALSHGQRGLPGGSSLASLFAGKRGARNCWTKPPLTRARILAWVDAFHERTGGWPTCLSGPTEEAGLSWVGVNSALSKGLRGLPGGSSLARLLETERGVRNRLNRPRLTRQRILRWADHYYRRTGSWPTGASGAIENTDETWSGINAALHQGSRGLRGGSSLAQLLAEQRGKRNHLDLPPLSIKKILAWADEYFECRGAWPKKTSGPILDAPGATWSAIDNALRMGQRGLPGGDSLPRLLERKRGVNVARRRTQTVPQAT